MDYETRVKNTEASLGSVYQPQTDFYNKQVAELPAFYDGQRTQADMARVNAFRGIETAANSRGMFFSGQPIDQQMKYNFGTFNPTMAKIGLDQNNKKSSLEQALVSLGMQKNSQARNIVSDQIKQEEAARQKEIDRQLQAKYHADSMRMQMMNFNARNQPADPAKGFNIKQKDNNAGYMFSGPNGRPVSMAQYAQVTGVDMQQLLKNSSSAYDKQAYNYIQSMKKSGFNEDQMLARMQTKYSALF